MKPIQNLTKDKFKDYGTIIDYTEAKNDGWEIVVRSQGPGWRIALLEIERHASNQLEYHPLSKESFEPLTGTSLIAVAAFERPEEFEVFLLDGPVCLHEKVWHQVICLSEKATMKITENLDVNCVYYDLKEPFQAKIV